MDRTILQDSAGCLGLAPADIPKRQIDASSLEHVGPLQIGLCGRVANQVQ